MEINVFLFSAPGGPCASRPLFRLKPAGLFLCECNCRIITVNHESRRGTVAVVCVWTRGQGKLLINAVSKVGIQIASPADAVQSKQSGRVQWSGKGTKRCSIPILLLPFLFAVNPSMRHLPAPYLPSGAQIEPPKREMSDGDAKIIWGH